MNDPRTLTEAISRIATKLSSLDWVDVVYTRVHVQDIKLAGQDRPQVKPMVYSGNGEYVDARPNDNYKSVLLFASNGPEKSDYNQAAPFGHARNHIIRATRPVTLYGWVNLTKVPNSYNDNSGYAERIKLSLKKALKDVRCVSAIGEWRDGVLNDVFKPFVVSDLDTKFDRFPFAAFRLELSIFCIETNVA